MPRGQAKTTQERLDKVKERRAERKAKFDKAEAPDIELEASLNEKLVRERVMADFAAETEQRVQAELAKLNGSQADAVDEVGREQFANV